MIEIDNTTNHSIQLYRKFKDNREKLCDVQLKVQDTLIPAHKIILASNSDYFQYKFAGTIFFSDSDEIIVTIENEFTLDSIKSILHYFYYGKLIFSAENVTNLLEAAAFYGVEFIREKCCEFLITNMTPENCIQTRYFFDRMNLNINEVDKFIVNNLEIVLSHEDFLGLNEQFILNFFTSILKYIKIRSAEKFYLAIIAWIKHDEGRKLLSTDLIQLFPIKYLKTILKYIKHEKLVQENIELTSWALNARIDMELFEDRSKSIFVMEKYAAFYWIFNSETMEIKRTKCQVNLIGYTLITVNTRIFVIGGKFKNGGYAKVCWIFDPITDVWCTIPFPYEIQNYKGCYLNGKIYLLGRKDGKVEIVSFDIETKDIKKLPDPACDNCFNIFTSNNFIHLISTPNKNQDQYIKIARYSLHLVTEVWQTLSTWNLNVIHGNPITFQNGKEKTPNLIKALSVRPKEQFLPYYELIQNYFKSTNNLEKCQFGLFSNMITINSSVYGLSKEGIYCLKGANWENIVGHNFEDATATCLVEIKTDL